MTFLGFRTLFFNDGKTVYQAPDFMALADCLSTDGVYKSDALKVVANSPADLSVKVSAGRMKKSISGNGYVVTLDAAETVLINANTSGYNRIDAIVIKIDTVNSETTAIDIEGTPSSSPVAPTIPAGCLQLAEVSVGNNVSVINDNVITDKRVIAGPSQLGQPNGIASLDSNAHVLQSQLGIKQLISVHNDNYDIDLLVFAEKFAVLTIACAYKSGLANFLPSDIAKKYYPKANTSFLGYNNADNTPLSGIIWHGNMSFDMHYANGAAINDCVFRAQPIIYEIQGE